MATTNNTTVTVKDVYKSINAIDLTAKNGSRYNSNLNEQIGDECRARVEGLLPEGSLAKKIYDQMCANLVKGWRLSEKQQWVIAYELMKNEEYVAYVAEQKHRSLMYDLYGDFDYNEEEDEE